MKKDEKKGLKEKGKPKQLGQPSSEELIKQLNQAEAKAADYMNKSLRALADLENMRKRAELDLAHAHKYAIEKFAFELLAAVDNLERTLEIEVEPDNPLKNIHVGVELTLKMLLDVFNKFGITQINPLGEAFNPEQHSAMSTKEDPNSNKNTVLEVLQKGYMLKGRLLRPALVIVSV